MWKIVKFFCGVLSNTDIETRKILSGLRLNKRVVLFSAIVSLLLVTLWTVNRRGARRCFSGLFCSFTSSRLRLAVASWLVGWLLAGWARGTHHIKYFFGRTRFMWVQLVCKRHCVRFGFNRQALYFFVCCWDKPGRERIRSETTRLNYKGNPDRDPANIVLAGCSCSEITKKTHVNVSFKVKIYIAWWCLE